MPLRWRNLQQPTQAHGSWLMVDDAHGMGVIGEAGRGSCWQQAFKPDLLVVTFGKAFGAAGRQYCVMMRWLITCCSSPVI